MKIAFDVDVLAKQMPIRDYVRKVADWGYKYIEQSPHPRINPFYKHPLFSKECEEEHRKALQLCGSKSGREVDKVKECGFTVQTAECGAPYFQEAELVLVCRKRFAQPMDPDCMPQEIKTKWYPEKDYHTLYIGDIVEVLVKD